MVELIKKYKVLAALILAFLLMATVIIFSSPAKDTGGPIFSLPKRATPTATPTPVRAEMYTRPLSVEAQLNRPFEIAVTLDAKGHTINGADSVIHFDPAFIKVVKISPMAENSKDFILMRKLVEKDRIIITAIRTKPGTEPTQELTVARMSLIPLKIGGTTLTFEHFPGATTGSTVIQAEDSANILDKVAKTDIIIK